MQIYFIFHTILIHSNKFIVQITAPRENLIIIGSFVKNKYFSKKKTNSRHKITIKKSLIKGHFFK